MNIEDIDWRGVWRDRHSSGEPNPDPASWNSRAEAFAKRDISPYTQTFIEYLDLHDGESVMDMGCGTGDIALRLAEAGHDVLAVDFSCEMLRYLEQFAGEKGIANVRPLLMSWQDDWRAHGIEPDSVDVAFASRSSLLGDIGVAFDKLSQVARRRVALTVCSGSTPTEDLQLLYAIGRRSVGEDDLAICFNILWQMGVRPEVRYIDGGKRYSFATPEKAVEASLSKVVDPTPAEAKAVEQFVLEHLVEDPEPDPDNPFTLDYKRCSNWAFISWNL